MIVSGYCLNSAELAALHGLPYPVIALYCMAIRPRMNWVSGMLGENPLISWQALGEWLYVEPRPGVLGGSPTRHSMRRMALQLARAGLIRVRSRTWNRQLIFEVLLASRYESVQNKAAHEKEALPARAVPRETPPKAAHAKKGKAARHLFVSTGVHLDTRATGAAVDNSAGLVYPATGLQVNRALTALIGKSKLLNGSAQLVLDELRGAMDGKPACRNPVAYLKTLIAAVTRGEFKPTERGARIARDRQTLTLTRSSNAAEQHGKKPAPAIRVKGLQHGRATAQLALDAMLEQLKGKGKH